MPFKDPQRKREYERSRIPRRRAWRRYYSAQWRARRRREASIPPGRSRALDALRAQLKGTRGAERERIEAAIVHLERILAGERVRPRDPARLRMRPDRSQTFNRRPAVATAAAAEAAAEAAERVKPTGRVRGSWLDKKLPPE